MAIDSQTTERLFSMAKPYYPEERPYHNWSHPLKVRAEFERLADSYERAGGENLDRNLGVIAAGWHDVDHYIDPKSRGYATKEALAADMAADKLAGELEPGQVQKIHDAIIATTANMTRRTPLDILLHYADMENVAHPDYDYYLDHATKLWRENGSPDWRVWRDNSVRVIHRSIAESTVELPSIGMQLSEDSYAVRANNNMRRFMTEPEPQ